MSGSQHSSKSILQRLVAEANELGSMQMVEALGPASVVNAVIFPPFLFWRVLRALLRIAEAGSHTGPSINGHSGAPPGSGGSHRSGCQHQD